MSDYLERDLNEIFSRVLGHMSICNLNKGARCSV